MVATDFVRKVAATIEEYRMARPKDHILVAVSGGADSVALFAALHALSAAWELRLTAWHLDHGLRGPEGARDRAYVEALAQRFGHPVIVASTSIQPGANLEARARQVRYRLLEAAGCDAGCSRLAVGHTLTDQAETVLMRLLRGAGTRGLGGMPPMRGRIIRPLLACRREEARAFLREQGLVWMEDATNTDERFTRNRIRRRVLPALVAHAGEGVVTALAQTAALLRDDDGLLDDMAQQALARAMRDAGLDGTVVRTLTPALRRRVLRRWLVAARGSLVQITRKHIAALESALGRTESTLIVLPGGCVRLEAGTLSWAGELMGAAAPFCYTVTPGGRVTRGDLGWELRLSYPVSWHGDRALPQDQWHAVFDCSDLPSTLSVRSPRPGDRIRPLGTSGRQKLQDAFVNAKVPRTERATRPVLAAGDEVLWVPGVRRSSVARVRAATIRVVWAECQRLG